MPSNEEGDRLGIVHRLDGHGGRGRMERASGLDDLPDDRKTSDASGFKIRGPFGEIDGILDLVGDDEIGIARAAASRERVDVVRDRPSLLRRQGVDEPRHRRAVEAGRHRPEDVFARRPAAERPALREVRRAYRLARVVRQGGRRGSVTPAERAVAFDAARLLVELLPERDRLGRGGWRTRERHGLRGASRASRSRRRTS